MPRRAFAPCRAVGLVLVLGILSIPALRASAGGGDSSFAPGAPADPAYVADGARVEIPLSTDWIALRERPGIDPLDLAHLAGAEPILAPPAAWRRLPIDVTLARLVPSVPKEEVRAAVRRLRRDPALEWAATVHHYGPTLEILTDSIFVAFDSGTTASERRALHESIGADDAGPVAGVPGHRRVRLRRDDPRGVLDLAGAYRAMAPAVRSAEPEFYFEAGLSVPDDPYFPLQWALRNTGQLGGGRPGADMRVEEAWDLTTGDPSILVAIVDEGIDMDHEDLAANVAAGFDVTDEAASPPGGVPGNASCGDGHGTACAGIAAAVAGNGTGIAGVAPGCRILSVRIGRGNVWTKNDWAAAGINAAWQNGAAVVSNSWGGGSPSSLITSAVAAARTSGRGGLGSVVLFASGNANATTVDYPASLATAVAVGATSPCDSRKSPASCDGESWWGSNRGSALDVVAPGVLVHTTDVAAGCAYSSGSYFASFNGTSAAVPHAAGVAALVLSMDPTLTASAVQAVLEDTAADLVGNPAEDLPGRDDAMGHGRLDAFAAVAAVAGGTRAPVVSSVFPASGPQKGGTPVTILGSGFFASARVLFGEVEAAAVARIDPTRLECVAPPSAVLGPVAVSVETAFGTGSSPGAYSYAANPPRLLASGAFDQGATLSLVVEGGAGRRYGLAVSNLAGPTTVKGIVICLSTRGTLLEVLHRRNAPPLGATGVGLSSWVVPEDFPTLGSLFFQAVVEDGAGSLEVTNCETVTIF